VGTGLIDRIRTVRFDWASGASSPTVVATRTLLTAPGSLPGFAGVQIGGIDFDQLTDSHWVVAHSAAAGWAVSRLGYSGGATESQATTRLCDVAWAMADFEGSFPLAYTNQVGSNVVLYGSELTYAPDSISGVYGTSCSAPGVTVTTNRSYAGREFYLVRLINLAPGTPAIYLLGSASGGADLTSAGLPGCFLNVALPALGTLVAVADGLGDAQVTFALPDAPLFLGDVFSQWFYFDPAAAPVPFRAWRGVRHQVR
jgi:hypothetical protein